MSDQNQSQPQASRVTLNLGGDNGGQRRTENDAQASTARGPGLNPWATSGTSLFGQKLSMSSGSEIFNKILGQMKDKLKEAPEIGIDVVGFPRERFENLTFSVIAVVRNLKKLDPNAPQQRFVTYQAFILEATGELPRPIVIDPNSRNPYTVTPTAEEANNKLLIELIETQLKAMYRNGELEPTVYPIDPVVIPRTLSIDTPDAVQRLFVDSTVAVETRSWTRLNDFSDFNFPRELGAADTQLPVSVDYTSSGDILTNALGHPVNIDAFVVTSVEKISSNRAAPVMNKPDASRLLSRAGVMVDLVPAEPDVLESNRSRRSERVDALAAWVPRVTVTSIEQFKTRTIAGVFFAVASSAELGRNRSWSRTYRGRRGGRDQQNLRDIGFLNIEANLDREKGDWGTPVDTNSPDFNDRAMDNFLDLTVSRDVMLAVDCATSGPQAYMTTALYNLARGGVEMRQRARAEMIRSLEDATDGLIRDHFDMDRGEFVDGEGELIHMGSWFDTLGKSRDLRELDQYLAIAVRMGANNPEGLMEYVRTYYNTDVNEARRMSDRLRILESAAAGTVNVTGTALRVQLNPALIDAFNRALIDGKLPLVSRETGNGDAFMNQRAVSSRTGNRYSGSGFGRAMQYDRGGRGDRFAAVDRY